MAGIGFELEKLLRSKTYTSALHAYTYAILVSAGPWLFSVIAILLVALATEIPGVRTPAMLQFKTLIIYMISSTLIMSSTFQFSFTRYIADRKYEKKIRLIKPNFNGACLLLGLFSGFIGLLLVYFVLPGVDLSIRALVWLTLVILSLIWLSTVCLSGLRAYRQIIVSFFVGYAVVIIACYFMRFFYLKGFLCGFLLGQFVILVMLMLTFYNHYPSRLPLRFNFMKPSPTLIYLIFASVFYNAGVWVDKYLFWYLGAGHARVIGLLNESLIYDTPIFIATMSTIFGMAFFFLAIETSFIHSYKRLFDEICGGFTLNEIYETHNELVDKSRNILFGVIKIQGMLAFIFYVMGTPILGSMHVDIFYIYILNILMLALALNVVYWAVMEMLFYLDKYKYCCYLNLLFLVSNFFFTWLSIKLNIFYYGFGLAASFFVTTVASMIALNLAYRKLEYNVFAL